MKIVGGLTCRSCAGTSSETADKSSSFLDRVLAQMFGYQPSSEDGYVYKGTA